MNGYEMTLSYDYFQPRFLSIIYKGMSYSMSSNSTASVDTTLQYSNNSIKINCFRNHIWNESGYSYRYIIL